MVTTGARGVDELEAISAARALNSSAALLSRVMGRSLAPWNMTWPQAMSLILLRAQNGPTTATRLVEQLGLGRTAMTAVVDRLERRGWVERRPHPTDRRVALVELTDAGRRVADDAMDAVRTTAEALFTTAKLPARSDAITMKLIERLR